MAVRWAGYRLRRQLTWESWSWVKGTDVMVLFPKERTSSWGPPGFAVLGPGPEEDWLPALPPSSCPPTQPMSIRPWNASPAPHLPANIGLDVV